MRIIIDTNSLRSEELRLFLSKAPENFAVLTDYAWMEAYKGDAVISIINSMEILSQYPSQVLILRGTKFVASMDARAPGMSNRMLIPKSKKEFARSAIALQQATKP